MQNFFLNLNNFCVYCDIVFSFQIISNISFHKKESALKGQVKFHSEKCCGSLYDLLVICGVLTQNLLHASISTDY